MTRDDKIAFFQEMISCNHNLYRWTYDGEMKVLDTNCPEDYINGDMMAILNFTDKIRDFGTQSQARPLIMVTEFGLIWIAAYAYEGNQLSRVYVIGPAFTGKNTLLIVKKKLDTYNIGIKLRSRVFKKIDEVPIIPTNQLLQMAVMLHYSVTDEKITTDLVRYFSHSTGAKDNEVKLISEEHRGIWYSEQQLMGMIRDGNPDYKKALAKSMTLSSGVKAQYSDSMRQHKNNSHVLLTLCSRASIEGGLSPSVAYSMNDYYATLIEACSDVSESSEVTAKMLEDFVERVRQSKEEERKSPQIQEACEYIATHIREKIALEELAVEVGYSEYYLSHKFKIELGIHINDYIRGRKIEEAKLLLAGTNMSIIDISNELAFSNRSYFYTSFHKETGMSPTAYRSENSKV